MVREIYSFIHIHSKYKYIHINYFIYDLNVDQQTQKLLGTCTIMEARQLNSLTKDYKEFLQQCEHLVIEVDSDTPLNVLNDIHGEISDKLSNSKLEISDMNHMLSNYKRTNRTLEFIKQMIGSRNYKMTVQILRSDAWKKMLHNLKKTLTTHLKHKQAVHKKSIEKAVLILIEKQNGTWNSITEYVEMRGSKITSIDIIDPDDLRFISQYVVENSSDLDHKDNSQTASHTK
jgi:hypothetical protein